MQSPLPDLTPYLPWLAALALGAWRLWEAVKRGRKADAEERAEEVHKSLLPVIRRAEEAEALLALREKHLAIVEAEKLRAEAEAERLKQRLAEREETEDRLQTAMNNLVGRMDELERGIERLPAKGKTDERRR